MSWISSWTGQDADKRARQYQGKATAQAETDYREKAPFRGLAQQTLLDRNQPDFSADYAGGPTYRAVNDPLASQAFAAQSKSLADLGGGPDRLALVRQAMSDFDKESAPRLQAGIRSIGQDASRLGRLGAGGVTTSIGDLASDTERSRQTMQNEMIRQAIEATQGDKYRTADLAGRIGESAYGRAAGERGYGDALAQQAIGNRVARRAAEQGAQAQTFGQGLDLAGLGYSSSPEGAYARQAAAEQNEAARRSAGFTDLIGTAAQIYGSRGGKSSGGGK